MSSQGSAVRPRKPASCPGQVLPPSFAATSGSVTAAGSRRGVRRVDPAAPANRRSSSVITPPTHGQSLGGPGFAPSTPGGECGTPVIIVYPLVE